MLKLRALFLLIVSLGSALACFGGQLPDACEVKYDDNCILTQADQHTVGMLSNQCRLVSKGGCNKTYGTCMRDAHQTFTSLRLPDS